VIKYCEFIGIFNGESNVRFLTDVEALKHGDPIGLETLVVHAINDEY